MLFTDKCSVPHSTRSGSCSPTKSPCVSTSAVQDLNVGFSSVSCVIKSLHHCNMDWNPSHQIIRDGPQFSQSHQADTFTANLDPAVLGALKNPIVRMARLPLPGIDRQEYLKSDVNWTPSIGQRLYTLYQQGGSSRFGFTYESWLWHNRNQILANYPQLISYFGSNGAAQPATKEALSKLFENYRGELAVCFVLHHQKTHYASKLELSYSRCLLILPSSTIFWR